MAEICCGIVTEGGGGGANSLGCETTSSRAARRRRMEIRRFKFVAGVSATSTATSDSNESVTTTAETKRLKMDNNASTASSFRSDCDNAYDNYNNNDNDSRLKDVVAKKVKVKSVEFDVKMFDIVPKFGVASVCGRRRDMEDAVAVHPSFKSELHYFGVYDGHGCSHVAAKCKERLHELVKEELFDKAVAATEWKSVMEKSFGKMDKEVVASNEGVIGNCRCELQTPECDAVGSTAVVAVVTPNKIIVANCGDSRAVLCRNGKAVALSSDHKPDRPDELNRIEEAGGRVIFWDGPRVLGVLAMSRAIGDNYLKPYVSCEPEVTITDRTTEDDCLILASDGLWDVVSNDTACGVARMCLRGKVSSPPDPPQTEDIGGDTACTTTGEEVADKACADASMLLTKLALARHSADNVSVVVINLRKDT
ncbi:putative protein phosphatase 2C 24 [Silene latifolia]|uniref:putative protein phosphatase 2C 24 n=1 Tax=Silene latifolia TaxID=37657 RepID=UPI003D7899CB